MNSEMDVVARTTRASTESTEKRKWRPARGRRDLWLLGIVAAWVALDQITKVVVRESLNRGEHWELAPFFRFSHITNDGAAFGLLDNMNTLLAVTTVVVIVVLAIYYFVPPIDHWLPRLGLALILGGALGNLIDRLYQGRVTDFINFSHYPAFNLADSGITLGVIAIMASLILWSGGGRGSASKSRPDDTFSHPPKDGGGDS
ncbi:MAG: signal peptidase II [Chloroflexi bacterium]|nr:signal peptidase II [Chloroflexota bacterium]